MPKVAKPPTALLDPIPSGPCAESTRRRRARAAALCLSGKEMVEFRCERCRLKGLRCFVDTATGSCAGCIASKATCQLFVPETEWERVEEEEKDRELSIAQLRARRAEVDAQLAQEEVKLLEAQKKKRQFARRDLVICDTLEPPSEETASGTVATVESRLSTPEPLADLGWLQADPLSPSFFVDFSPFDCHVPASASADGTPPPVSCN